MSIQGDTTFAIRLCNYNQSNFLKVELRVVLVPEVVKLLTTMHTGLSRI